MHESDFNKQSGLFTIRGSLDGEEAKTYIDDGEQFIGLKVDNKTFLLEISLINEIVMLSPLTHVPRAPKYIDGVMNLRGTIMPTINMRKLLGLPKGNITSTTRVVIIKEDQTKMGLLIDEVSTVISLKSSDIENKSLPSQGNGIDLISRVCRKDDKIFGVLDVHKIIAAIHETMTHELEHIS